MPVLRGSGAKSIEHGVSPIADGPNACNPAIPHAAFDCLSTRPNPRGPGIDATSRSRLLEGFLTAHDLAIKKARGGGTAGEVVLRPIQCPTAFAFALALAPAQWKLASSMLRLGYVQVWTFAGAISSPTFV
ncbi:uncharacterized protein N7459_006736 [Penicillium hispanicum]|uniref:uncharacterized protein n=1 Tax=Penicillium hispanicum TaxID=1080232 RepID=UPI00253F95FD|nr:uncharacterized protein N7459_006736 [Penicillium hispanicum]KAJ5577772.1 hypothetical protein N7459_006736 [Penicillium hispanicum]